MNHEPNLTAADTFRHPPRVFWTPKAGEALNRLDCLTLASFQPISAETLLRLEPQPALTKTGRISRAKNAKPTPVNAWIFPQFDSEFQTLPEPPQLADGRIAREMDLGDLEPAAAEDGRFFYEVRKVCETLGRGRIPLSAQLNFRTDSAPSDDAIGVYSHPDLTVAYPMLDPRIPLPEGGCFVADRLAATIGTSVRFYEIDTKERPYETAKAERVLTVSSLMFFGLADYQDLFPPSSYPKVFEFLNRSVAKGNIEMKRRLRVSYSPKAPKGKKRAEREGKGKNPPQEFIFLPLMAVIGEERSFAVRLHIVDPSAQLGQSGASLIGYSGCAGQRMDSKEVFSSADKGRMLAQWARAAVPHQVAAGHFGSLLTATGSAYLSADKIQESHPGAFVNYAAGDVRDLGGAVSGVERMFREGIYGPLNLGNYYQIPRMSAGATVVGILRAAVLKAFEEQVSSLPPDQLLLEAGASPKGLDKKVQQWDETGIIPKEVQDWLIDISFEQASAEEISKENNLMAQNAKVLGGRCINLAPHRVNWAGVLVDMDLASAYTKSITVQPLPFGRPRFIGAGFDRNDDRLNDYRPLGEILAKHGSELVPGLWQIWFTVKDLPHGQDFFASWQEPPAFRDFNSEELEIWLERTDTVKHFTHEVVNGCLTADGLDWLMNIASRELRDYILNNALVTSAAWYPADYRCSSLTDFVRKTIAWQKNTEKKHRSEVSGGTETSEKNFCPYWFALELGELAIRKFDSERAIHKKVTKVYKLLKDREVFSVDDAHKLSFEDRAKVLRVLNGEDGRAGYKGEGDLAALIDDAMAFDKHPLDELFKLVANTSYGVMVSRFFKLSNPIVGNNVTARVRAQIWYFEKACGSFMSITDGGVFDANRVVVRKTSAKRPKKPSEKALTYLHRQTATELKDQHLQLRPLGGFKRIAWEEGNRILFEHADPEKTVTLPNGLNQGEASPFIDQLVYEHTMTFWRGNLDRADQHPVALLNYPRLENDRPVLELATNPFSFESKGIVERFALHGQSNYIVAGGSHGAYKKVDGQLKREAIAMRGIKKSLHPEVVAPFLRQLLSNADQVDRSEYWKVYLESFILKTGEFADRYESFYKETFLKPGDSYYKARLLRECSISGFRFQTLAQQKAWETRHGNLRQYNVKPPAEDGGFVIEGGQSFESFYQSDDGRFLDFATMNRELDAQIIDGRFPDRREGKSHPNIEPLALAKFRLKEMIADTPEPTYLSKDEVCFRYRQLLIASGELEVVDLPEIEDDHEIWLRTYMLNDDF